MISAKLHSQCLPLLIRRQLPPLRRLFYLADDGGGQVLHGQVVPAAPQLMKQRSGERAVLPRRAVERALAAVAGGQAPAGALVFVTGSDRFVSGKKGAGKAGVDDGEGVEAVDGVQPPQQFLTEIFRI